MGTTAMKQAICGLIGRRLRMRRRLLELTQKEVGARCGLTFQQIQKYEAGLVDLSVARVVKLAEALQMPLSELFAGLQTWGDAAHRTLPAFVVREARSITG
jgi:transcriptional regulator with XRE-family HTH domain